MSIVTITTVNVLNNPAKFDALYKFEITFECIEQLKEDLEFKLIYVGSANDQSKDQILESVLVGPVPIGTNKFVLEAEPPNIELLPNDEILGVTVILLSCLYKEMEFVRCGYYVNNEYNLPELNEAPPDSIQWSNLYRNVLITKPRVTRFQINWDGNSPKENNDIPKSTAEEGLETDEVEDHNVPNEEISEESSEESQGSLSESISQEEDLEDTEEESVESNNEPATSHIENIDKA